MHTLSHGQSGIFEHNMSFHIFCIMHACIIQDIKWNTYYRIHFQGLGNMGDWWEARISSIENIQKEFGYDIREKKEWLARLTNLFENHIQTVAVHPRDPTPLPNQQVHRPFIQTTSHLPRETHRPNPRQPMPTALPAFMATSRPVDQLSGSRGKPSRQKTGKNKI